MQNVHSTLSHSLLLTAFFPSRDQCTFSTSSSSSSVYLYLHSHLLYGFNFMWFCVCVCMLTFSHVLSNYKNRVISPLAAQYNILRDLKSVSKNIKRRKKHTQQQHERNWKKKKEWKKLESKVAEVPLFSAPHICAFPVQTLSFYRMEFMLFYFHFRTF